MRFAFCSAALLAGGLLLASITAASAESQGAEQKPPEQGEQKPPDQAEGEKNPEDQKSAEQQAEERIKQEIEQYREAAAKLSLSPAPPSAYGPGAGSRASCGATTSTRHGATSIYTTASAARPSI